MNDLIEAVDEIEKLSEENQELFKDFLLELDAEGLSTYRKKRYKQSIKRLAEFIDFKLDEASAKELKQLAGKINNDKIRKYNGEPYSEWSKSEFKKLLQKYYTTIGQGDKIEWLKASPDKRKLSNINPDKLLTPKDAKKMIQAADNLRDKALFYLLWDTGARVGGLLKTQENSHHLKWKHVTFKDDLMHIEILDKTGWRTLKVRDSMPIMKQHWENSSKEMEEPVFKQQQAYRNGDKPLTAQGLRKKLREAKKRTSLSERKKVNPHAWRKARATHKARIGWNQSQICYYFGWVEGSKEAAKYIRLSERDMEKALDQEYGLETKHYSKEDKALQMRECPNCGRKNAAIATVCINCSTELSNTDTPSREDSPMQKELDKLRKQMNQIEENLE